MTREEAIAVLRREIEPSVYEDEKSISEAVDMAIEALSVANLKEEFESADSEQGYTEWLEKIIVDNEGANEWLCEDTLDLEWCEKNCHYSSIQAECLRHLYEVSKGGAE